MIAKKKLPLIVFLKHGGKGLQFKITELFQFFQSHENCITEIFESVITSKYRKAAEIFGSVASPNHAIRSGSEILHFYSIQ